MDTQTRHALKKDKFAQATASSVSWVSGHRSGVLRWAVVVLLVVLVFVGALIFWNMRSGAADVALGAAMDTYGSPLLPPGAPAESGVYSSAKDRSQAANTQFEAIAQQYSWLPEAAKAHYFAGITDEELGQNSQAESELKTASDAWDRNLADLAKLALAELYHQTARDSQAIDLYNALVAKPSDAVPASMAQLDLADLYAATGKQDQARALWAKVKDGDKDGEAGKVAEQKLEGK